ncbi:MAG: hypothetical protein ACE5EM_10880 [Sphingomonadales bacterium]
MPCKRKIVHKDVSAQLDELALVTDRPLIVTDADEVLFRFLSCFEVFLHGRELYLDLASFALTGNVRRRVDDQPVDGAEIPVLLGQFFNDHAEHIPPVPGAADALAVLSRKVQIVVLSNIPLTQKPARLRGMEKCDMNYPLIANLGGKGGAVAAMADRVDAPVFFIDDLPQQIRSVAIAAEDVRLVHFVADQRLAALLEPATDCHHRSDDWAIARCYIENELNVLGY